MSEPSYPAEVNGELEGSEGLGPSIDRNAGTLAGGKFLVPACNLPAEILSAIFLILSKAPYQSEIVAPGVQRIPKSRWIAVTHVCHAWREAALDNTALWTTLPMISPAFTKLALTRTKRVLLCIKDRICRERDAETVKELLLSQPGRLGRVEIRLCTCFGLPEVLTESLQKSADVLETLSLTCRSAYSDSRLLPPFFQSTPTPSLKAVVIHDFVIDWTNVPLPTSLTQLSLRADPYNPRQPLTLAKLLASLDGLPLLEDLELYCIIPLASPNPAERERLSRPPVAFSSLKRLALRDMLGPIATFMDHVDLPETTFLHLFVHAVDYVPSECTVEIGRLLLKIQATCPAFRRPIHHLGFSPLHDLEIQSNIWESQKIVLGFQELAADLACPTIQISLSPIRLPPQGLLGQFNGRLDMSTLVSMEVVEKPPLPLSIWTSIFKHCDMLEEVTLSHCRSFIHALKSMPLEQNGGSSSSAPWLPSLKTLRLRNAFLEKEDEGLSNLLEVLPRRSAAGYPLLELTVETGKYRNDNFGHYLGRLEAIPNLVVHWIKDEVEGGPFDEEEPAETLERYVDVSG